MKIIHTLIAASMAAAALTAGHPALQARELPTDVSQKNKPATLKILLGKDKEKALLEVKGRYHLYNPADGVLIDTGILGKRAPIHFTPQGLEWADILPIGTLQIRFVPGDSQSTFLVDGIQYRGCIEVYVVNGKIDIINEVDIESYLKATLAPLFVTEKNQELLDAIAITARTHAYYLLSRNLHAYWHLEASEVNYQGQALAHQNQLLDRAIDTTRHMVMTYKSSPFAATWTKDSAGKTAPFSVVFRKEALAPQGVQSPIALRDREKRQWNLTLTKEQLSKIAETKNVSGVDLFLDQNSGKVYALRIHDGMGSKDVDFLTLQKAVGAQKLRSNDFTINLKRENIIFSGYGEGHGVGLCLYSARFMADNGEKATSILNTFFPQTKLEHLRTVSEAK